MTFCIMTPFHRNTEYYKKFREHYWLNLQECFRRTGYTTKYHIFLLLTGEGGDFDYSLLEEDIQKIEANPMVKVHHEELGKRSIGKGTLVKMSLAYAPSDYYTFLDFDDSYAPNYFLRFVEESHTEDIVLGNMVRVLNGDIIPKEHLIWRPKAGESKIDFFLSGRYGIPLCGRLFSNSLLSRVEPRINYTYDKYGFGEENKLSNLLFFNSKKIGYTVGLYLWDYGDGKSTDSKTFDKEIGLANIEDSLVNVPEEYREQTRERYLKIMELCYDSRDHKSV